MHKGGSECKMSQVVCIYVCIGMCICKADRLMTPKLLSSSVRDRENVEGEMRCLEPSTEQAAELSALQEQLTEAGVENNRLRGVIAAMRADMEAFPSPVEIQATSETPQAEPL